MFYKCMCGGLNFMLITSLGLITNFSWQVYFLRSHTAWLYTSFVLTLPVQYFNSCLCFVHNKPPSCLLCAAFLVPPPSLPKTWFLCNDCLELNTFPNPPLPSATYAKSCRVLWPRWIGPRQSLSLANYDFHWRKWVRSSTSGNHPPFGGKKAS